MHSVAIVQSNYIPWKGYFDLIRSVDSFIFYDEVQYTKRDYRNRNTIKTSSGTQMLSVPVATKGKYLQRVFETQVSESTWHERHRKALQFAYGRSPYFKEVFELVESALDEIQDETYLSKINYKFIHKILSYLGCQTQLYWSMEIPKAVEGKNERLIELVRSVGGTTYLSGPAAKDYMDIELFQKNGVEVVYADYSDYPKYSQLHGDFIPNVSILDLLFNEGPRSPEFMKSMIK